MQDGKFKISGLQNQYDADKVLSALNEVWGVRQAEVSLITKEAVFSYDEQAASPHDFEQAILDLGYEIGQS
ncbi:heavy-metal-associated domain-containing protein [Neobacillus sp. D3-1R]|uniref:heavy-metal-associated domain-containing protein n=1 Tax=Neobacillus sp. D3-1R TaxID=3445778 RepID=UPI003F9FC3A7